MLLIFKEYAQFEFETLYSNNIYMKSNFSRVLLDR